MDWNQSTMYEQRVRFILEIQQRTFSFAESCNLVHSSIWRSRSWRTFVSWEARKGRSDGRFLLPHPPGRCRRLAGYISLFAVLEPNKWHSVALDDTHAAGGV